MSDVNTEIACAAPTARARMAFAALIAAMLCMAWTAAGARADSNTGTISGTITDSSGSPITTAGDVCVSAEPVDTDGSDYPLGANDATGRYSASGIPAGSYTIDASDCSSSRDDAETYYGGGYGTVVSLSAGGTVSADIQMQPGAEITGRVSDSAGNGLASACVESNIVDPSYQEVSYASTSTRADGTYDLKHIPVSANGATVEAYPCGDGNYVPQYYGGDWRPSSAAVLTLTPQQATTGIDLALPLGGTISGTVRDSNGSPVGGEAVCVDGDVTGASADGSGDHFAAYAEPDGAGHYAISGLPATSFDLTVFDCDATRNDVPAELDAIPVSVGQETAGHDFALAPATAITGHVYSGAGTTAPVGAAEIDATDQDPDGAGGFYDEYGSSDRDGSYTVKYVKPGDHYKVEFKTYASDESGTVTNDQWFNEVPTAAQATLLAPTLLAPLSGIDAHFGVTYTAPAPAPAPAPKPPATTTQPVSLAAIHAALTQLLVPHGRAATVATVIKKKGFTFLFVAPEPGRLTLTWSVRTKVVNHATTHHAAHRVRYRTTVVGRARAIVAHAGTVTTTLRLTTAGRRLLQAHKRTRLTSTASFTPSGAKAVSVSRKFTLRRR